MEFNNEPEAMTSGWRSEFRNNYKVFPFNRIMLRRKILFLAGIIMLCNFLFSCSVFNRGSGCPTSAIGAERILSGEINPKKVEKMKH